jgi:hypothetical protein
MASKVDTFYIVVLFAVALADAGAIWSLSLSCLNAVHICTEVDIYLCFSSLALALSCLIAVRNFKQHTSIIWSHKTGY